MHAVFNRQFVGVSFSESEFRVHFFPEIPSPGLTSSTVHEKEVKIEEARWILQGGRVTSWKKWMGMSLLKLSNNRLVSSDHRATHCNKQSMRRPRQTICGCFVFWTEFHPSRLSENLRGINSEDETELRKMSKEKRHGGFCGAVGRQVGEIGF